MWLTSSSVGRKFIMALTGAALVLFITFHCVMNSVAIFWPSAYNAICEFLGANWYALVATVVLAGGVFVHFAYAFWLTLQNRKARGNNRYAVTDKPAMVEWSSQNMLVLGIIVILGMGLHLYNFWYNMMYAELVHDPEMIAMATNGVYHIAKTFSCPVYTAIYMVWLAALWFHLSHGVWSMVQTVGWANDKWYPRLKCLSTIVATLICGGFALVAVWFYVQSICPCC